MNKTTAIIPAEQVAPLWRDFIALASRPGAHIAMGCGAVIEPAPWYSPYEWFACKEAYRVTTGRLEVAQ